jgi:hypothetical protein
MAAALCLYDWRFVWVCFVWLCSWFQFHVTTFSISKAIWSFQQYFTCHQNGWSFELFFQAIMVGALPFHYRRKQIQITRTSLERTRLFVKLLSPACTRPIATLYARMSCFIIQPIDQKWFQFLGKLFCIFHIVYLFIIEESRYKLYVHHWKDQVVCEAFVAGLY